MRKVCKLGKMGSGKSKIKIGKKGKAAAGSGPPTVNSRTGLEYEDNELTLLRRTIKRNPEIFVLNNLMMCVQFFGNYEEEIEHVKESLAVSREAELSKHLPPQKHVLLPDVLQEQLARNIGFVSTRQTFRPTIEPLQPVRVYVVHDNFDITEQNYAPHYSSVNDAVIYSLRLRPTEHQGYVRLQLLDEMPQLKSQSKEDDLDLSSTTREEDEIYSDGDSVYGPKPNSGIILSRQAQLNAIRNSKYGHSSSLPDLHDDEMYGERRAMPRKNPHGILRSCHNVRFDFDEENASSAEEHQYGNRQGRPRGDLSSAEGRRHPRQVPRSKKELLGNYSRASSTSSGYRSGNYAIDSDSSYNASQNFSSGHSYSSVHTDNTYMSKSIDQVDMLDDSCIETAELPRRCFKKVIYTIDGKIYDPREEKRQVLNSKQRRIKEALNRQNYKVIYVSSAVFMKYFVNLFVHRLAGPLGFDEEAVEDTKRQGCVVYCDKITSKGQRSKIEQYEIIPSVWLEWPECAQEWLDRARGTWPDYEDVGKIKDFGCYVVPEGFVPKKGSNVLQNLEWQLTFPAAERYLETRMSPAQAQVYLIALMLHKTFMRPIFDTMFGMTTAHIRNKLFWMIEENDRPSKWPDTRTGECLLTLLNSLYHSISQNEPILRDYFVKDRNLFQRVPSEHLLHTQKQLKRIIENPVMYVLHAIENIQHSDNFFPRLDYKMLLNILTANIIALMNPALMQQTARSAAPTQKQDHIPQDEKFDARFGFWDNAKMQKPQNKAGGRPVNKPLINPRKAADSIIEIPTRCAELEGPRLSALLDFFVQHFIQTAIRCHQYRAYRQKMVYLDHADRLSILLSEFPTCQEEGRLYRDKIKTLRRRETSSRLPDDPPETPKRNAEGSSIPTPIFTAPLKERFAPESPKPSPGAVQPDRTEEETARYSNLVNERETNNNVTKKVTKAVVHEVRFHPVEETIVTETAEEDLNRMGNGVEAHSGKQQSVVSLIERQDDSYLSETTYI